MQATTQFVLSVLNFAVFAGGLGYLLRRPGQEFLARRRHQIQQELTTAEEEYQQAKQNCGQGLERKKGLATEVLTAKLALQKEGELEKRSLISGAEALAGQIAQDTERKILQEKRRQEKKLFQKILREALKDAEQILRGGIKKEEEQRFLETSLSSLRKLEKFGI